MRKKDSKIIRQMRKGGRLNVSNIARRLNIPVSTASDRIRQIERRYIIKHSPLLDYPKLGYFAHTKIVVKLEHEKRKEFLGFMKEEECVNSIYHVNSGFDFLVDVVFRDAVRLKNWLETTKKRFGLDVTTFQILKIEEREGFMSK